MFFQHNLFWNLVDSLLRVRLYYCYCLHSTYTEFLPKDSEIHVSCRFIKDLYARLIKVNNFRNLKMQRKFQCGYSMSVCQQSFFPQYQPHDYHVLHKNKWAY